MRKSTLVILFSALTVILLPFSSVSAEEEGNHPFALSFGTVRTDANLGAINLYLRYNEQVDENKIFASVGEDDFRIGKGRLIGFSPDLLIQTGGEDAFRSVIAKIRWNYLWPKVMPVESEKKPGKPKSFLRFPLAIGFETDHRFDKLNLIGECGYEFIGRPVGKNQMVKRPEVGLFLQTGYKFEIKDTLGQDPEFGGAADESEEDTNSFILRAALGGSAEIDLLHCNKDRQLMRFLPLGRVWYDIPNSEIYYILDLILRLVLAPAKSFDLRYELGSGEPNLNDGNQFSANFTLRF
ncbi:MAG: hypothetical protein JRI61_09615 [Deltaproteobacteria bacterium]|nr:hypothetical protein [Deltaproteobacteria bacterium]